MSKISLNPFIVFRVSSNRKIACVVGSGEKRNEFLLDDTEVVELLLLLKAEREFDEAVDLTAAFFSVGTDKAASFLNELLTETILVQDNSIKLSEVKWEEYGWRDALDFHKSGRGLVFDPDNNQVNRKMQEYLDIAATGNDVTIPAAYKEIPQAKTIQLHLDTHLLKDVTLENISQSYVQANRFNNYVVSFDQFSEFMKSSHGTFKEINSILGTLLLTSSPSGGALHPIEAYIVVNNVENILPGLYHYDGRNNALETIREGDFRNQLTDICYQKEGIRTASFCVLHTIRWARHSWKYRYARSYRMILFDLGHLVQTCVLVGQGLGLGTFHNPAVNDAEARKFLELPDDFDEGILFSLGFGPLQNKAQL